MNKKIMLVGAMLVVGSQIFAQQNDDETNIDEVTVNGKISQQLYKTGKNVKLLTAEDLLNYSGQSLNEVLNQLTGFQITGNFNNATEPKSLKIQGGKSSNVLILFDGVPLRDITGNDYNVSDLRLMTLENVERIEVLNGASSVLYGSNASVSVINIITKKSAKKPIEGLMSARGGSFNTYNQEVGLKGKLGKFSYQINGSNEKSDGISSAEGDENFDKDGWEKQNIFANIGYSTKNLNIIASGGWLHNLHKYDEAAFTDGLYRGNDKQYFAGFNANYQYKNGQLFFNSRYSETERIGQQFYSNQYNDQYSYNGKNWFLELYNFYKINNLVNFIIGIQQENQKMGSKSLPWNGTQLEDVLLEKNTKISSFDAFAKLHFNYQNFNLDLGTRMTDNSKFGNHWVYSINPYYINENESFYLKIGYSFATAFIAPTPYQNFGSLPYVLPNFDLKPETNQSHQIDLSYGNKDKSLLINASFYLRNESDVFAYQTVDFVSYAGQYLNVDKNKVKGFDFGFDYIINNYISLGGNFSFVEKDDKKTILRQPKQRVNSYIKITPFNSTRIYLSHQFIGKRNDAYYDANSFSTVEVVDNSYNLFNININQKITKNLSSYLNVGNLFNTSYIDVIGFKPIPRNYTLGFRYQF